RPGFLARHRVSPNWLRGDDHPRFRRQGIPPPRDYRQPISNRPTVKRLRLGALGVNRINKSPDTKSGRFAFGLFTGQTTNDQRLPTDSRPLTPHYCCLIPILNFRYPAGTSNRSAGCAPSRMLVSSIPPPSASAVLIGKCSF